ncbi:MAG TPA: secondary thiamine-phosphate synthase enzyme YjbQ [Gaiellaceae bacterium]|nr:secondary thiamine-phosphate synthase enzyme YjbQ [Gaiellaceae bacterium]
MREIRITSERKTQLIDITDRVRELLVGESGAAALVYVPHTTAGITINEKIDPILVEDLERGFEQIVGDDLGWRHDDKDGPNGASHGRASVAGAQVIVPLRADGSLALGTYQALFLCEFDGPKPRSVYVAVLQ